MARTQKFSDDLLLEAVVRYAETTKEKIVAVDLAQWCHQNVPGLEDVRDYHFLRPIKVKNEKTGKVIDQKKRCTERIEEINHTRSITEKVKSNVLLFSASVNQFFDLPIYIQKTQAEEAKAIFDEIRVKYERATRENEALRKTVDSLVGRLQDVEEILPKIDLKIEKQNLLLNRVKRDWTDEKMKEVLRNMGIEDDKINFEQLKKSLKNESDEISNLNQIIRAYYQQTDMQNESWSLSAEVMKGLEE